MASFNKFAPAVRHALEVTNAGTMSSLEYLIEKACDYYDGKDIHWDSARVIACGERLKWRRERGIVEDARTHESAFRRNMLDDKKISPKKLAKLSEQFGQLPDPSIIVDILKAFHSIDQAKLIAAKLCKQYVELS